MSINIHTNYYQANLQRRKCYKCEKDFIVGKEFVEDRADDVYCPYCGNECTDNESWTTDDMLEELELGCLGIYYTEDEQIEGIRCSKCNKEMNEGYVICDGLQYYCSDECLHKEISEKEYKTLYEEGYAYWTNFED